MAQNYPLLHWKEVSRVLHHSDCRNLPVVEESFLWSYCESNVKKLHNLAADDSEQKTRIVLNLFDAHRAAFISRAANGQPIGGVLACRDFWERILIRPPYQIAFDRQNSPEIDTIWPNCGMLSDHPRDALGAIFKRYCDLILGVDVGIDAIAALDGQLSAEGFIKSGEVIEYYKKLPVGPSARIMELQKYNRRSKAARFGRLDLLFQSHPKPSNDDLRGA